MRRTLTEYLASVLRPLKGVWNLVGVGLPGAIAVILWGAHHAFAAWVVASATLIVLLGVAGYRLQSRVLGQDDRRAFLDSLGLQLAMGRHLLDSVERDQGEFQDALENWTPEIPAEKEKLEALLRKQSKDMTDWRKEVSGALKRRLGYSYVARFESNAGLVAAIPPAKLTFDVFADRWRDHEMRLQRLLEVIVELSTNRAD